MSWCQPVFRKGDEDGCADGGDAEGGDEESESAMEGIAGRDVKGTSTMDAAVESECRAVVVWSDADCASVESGEVVGAGSW